MTILPAHGGMVVHSRAPSRGPDLLVDCGDSNAVQYVTSRFLRAQGLDAIPALLLTHGDIRHVGGTELLGARFPLNRVCVSGLSFRSPVYRKALRKFEAEHLLHTLTRGDLVCGWTVLHPESSDRFSLADDGAMVLEGNFHGVRMLLMPDLGRQGQEALINRFPELRADIVVAGLPVRGEPLCEPLLELVDPQLIVIADSELPAQERLSQETRTRLERRRVPVISTRERGAVTVRLRDGAATVRASQAPDGRWLVSPRPVRLNPAGSGN